MDRAEFWQYRGGTAGHGKWKWMDAECSRILEDAYQAGEESVTMDAEDGWVYYYDLIEMTQTSIPSDDQPRVTRPIQRKVDQIAV